MYDYKYGQGFPTNKKLDLFTKKKKNYEKKNTMNIIMIKSGL